MTPMHSIRCTLHIKFFNTLFDKSNYLCSEATKESKDELGESEGKILVEEVAQEEGHSVVGPATMYQQQSLQEPVHTCA